MATTSILKHSKKEDEDKNQRKNIEILENLAVESRQLKEKQDQLTKKEEDSPGLNRDSRLETLTNRSQTLN